MKDFFKWTVCGILVILSLAFYVRFFYLDGVYYPVQCAEACEHMDVVGCERTHAVCCVGENCTVKRVR